MVTVYSISILKSNKNALSLELIENVITALFCNYDLNDNHLVTN